MGVGVAVAVGVAVGVGVSDGVGETGSGRKGVDVEVEGSGDDDGEIEGTAVGAWRVAAGKEQDARKANRRRQGRVMHLVIVIGWLSTEPNFTKKPGE